MKKQGYKDRADESYGMKMSGVMGHDKKPMKCNAYEAQQSDKGRIKMMPKENRGYPQKAWEYKY